MVTSSLLKLLLLQIYIFQSSTVLTAIATILAVKESQGFKASESLNRTTYGLASGQQQSRSCDPLSYKGYGCYCGYLGSGTPVDVIDQCCYYHDQCYSESSCSQIMQYLMPYHWTCLGPGMSYCGTSSYNAYSDNCATQLCECDRVLAECLSRYQCPVSKPMCHRGQMIVTVFG